MQFHIVRAGEFGDRRDLVGRIGGAEFCRLRDADGARLRMMHEAFELTEESTYVCWLPLYHDMGLIGNVVTPVYAGAPSILMSPLAFLQKPFRWLQAITRYRACVSGAPNFAYDLCVRKVTPEQRASLDLSSWRLAFNGAEPVRADTLARFTAAFRESAFHAEAFYPCYGLAEATLIVSGGTKAAKPVLQTVDAENFEQGRVRVSASEIVTNRALVGCGRAWMDERIVIADPESMAECPADQVGEIWVSGSNITQGYWGRAEETARSNPNGDYEGARVRRPSCARVFPTHGRRCFGRHCQVLL